MYLVPDRVVLNVHLVIYFENRGGWHDREGKRDCQGAYYMQMTLMCVERREVIEGNLERWRVALKDREMRINRSKVEYMCTTTEGNGRESIRLDGEEIKRVEKFKYLGSMVGAGGRMDEEIKHQIRAGWNIGELPLQPLVTKECH